MAETKTICPRCGEYGIEWCQIDKQTGMPRYDLPYLKEVKCPYCKELIFEKELNK